MAVFVLDKHGKPLMPCCEKRGAIRQQGAFVIQTASGKVEANWRYCRIVQRGAGYGYTQMNPVH